MPPAPRPEPLLRNQRAFLAAVQRLGVAKDEAVISALDEVNVPLTKAALQNYRTGEGDNARVAPLGLLDVILEVAGKDAIEVLNVIAKRRGLRVVHDTAAVEPSSRSITDETLDVVTASGKLVATVHAALADGVISDDDRAQIREALDHAKQEIAECEAKLDQAWSERPRPRAV